MPHTTQPGTIAMLNFESFPTAPTTSDIFADLSKIWAASHPSGVAPSPPPPLPPPIFPVPGPTPAPTPTPSTGIDECKARCDQRFPFTCFRFNPLKCSCYIDCEKTGGTTGAPSNNILGQVAPILAAVIGIILVLIAVALIVR